MKAHIWFNGKSWCARVNGQLHTGFESVRLMQVLWPYVLDWS